MKSDNKNCLSYWFPLIEKHVPVPKTEIIHSGDMTSILDGETPEGWHELLAAIEAARTRLGPECFLRTGHTSGKHQWSRTCHLTEASNIADHVAALVEWSAIVDFAGLPTNVWCVREMLPTSTIGTCPDFADMPVCREFRFFVKDGEVQCFHPYWPLEALIDGGFAEDVQLGWYNDFCRLDDPEPKRLAETVSRIVPGAWSVDVLETKRGWHITDMAEASRSFHWPLCENSPACE